MPKSRPNILYVMADDHASNAISLYGSRLASVFQTPNLDRIGKEGAILTNCHCTNSICTPSRATILTGQYPHTNGVKTLKDFLSTRKNTFPQMMQKAGYQTAVVGKWHVHSEPKGFDYYEILPSQGRYHNPEFVDQSADWSEINVDEISGEREGFYYPAAKVTEGHSTDVITDKSLEFLAGRNKKKPFMLMCHFKATHGPFQYHPRYENMFAETEIPEPDSLWEDKSHRSVGSRDFGTTISENPGRGNLVSGYRDVLDYTELSSKERTKLAYQKYLKDYLRCAKGIDDNVGRLLEFLDQENLQNDTIVIYTSDQGMFLGEHDYIDKRWIYEEALRMPFLIRYPEEIHAGTVVDDIITNVDFAETFLDFAGIKKTDEMEGRSFREAVSGNTPDDWPDRLYYRYWMHLTHHNNPAHYGIRTKKYKLIFFYGLPLDSTQAMDSPTPPGWELYDLKKDPSELKNVYEKPEYASVVKDLKRQLFEMKEELGDNDEKYPELLKRVAESN